MTSESIIFVLIYLFALLTAALEMVPISVAALLGAFLTMWFGLSYGVFTYEEATGFIDMKILGLLIGTMIVLEVAYRSGIFRLIALYAIKISGGDSRLLFVFVCLTSAVISMFLSDSTALLMIAAAAATISRLMDQDPSPYIVSAAIMVNLGGTSTLIGSVSNMIIGVNAGLSFNEFISYLAPCELILWMLTMFALYLVYRPMFGKTRSVPTYNPWESIEDKGLFNKSAFLLVLLIGLFLIQDQLRVGPEAVALGCAVLALSLTNIDPSDIFRSLDWETIFFLSGFSIIVKGLEKTGFLTQFSQVFLGISSNNPIGAAALMLWLSGLASSVVSNIAIALTFTPIIKGLPNANSTALWSALVLGTNLGGAATPMSGVVVVMAMNALKREGSTVSFAEFTRVGTLTTFIQLGFSTLYVILRFGLVG
ncbi:TPA: hypothetical protein EYP70_03680 [Candidatus Bathyarchaeota archaeon]|nr:hypothetical protein [Candidatus Bathyarchaeota archaeon]